MKTEKKKKKRKKEKEENIQNFWITLVLFFLHTFWFISIIY